MQTKQNKINESIETTLKNLTNIIDVDTVVGSPIKNNDGEIIIPLSKVSVGLLSGGGEYGKVNIFSKNSSLPYSTGNGAVISIKPCGFLIGDKFGYKMISVSNSPYEKLVEKATDFIERLQKDGE